MKTKVFIAGNTGIESVTHVPGVTSLPDRICYSDEEVYESDDEMNAESFILRLKHDPTSKPSVTGCRENVFFTLMNNALSLAYEQFVFILSKERTSYYRPWIDRFIEENPKIPVYVYEARSSLYPAVHLAIDAEARLRAGEDYDDVLRAMSYYDEFNSIYMFSYGEDSFPKVTHQSIEEAGFRVRPKSMFYYIQPDSPEQRRLKKGTTIKSYLEEYCHEIEDKNIIPFILYTNPRSELTRALEDLLFILFPKLKNLKKYPLSPDAVLKYGENACGIGYLLKREVLE